MIRRRSLFAALWGGLAVLALAVAPPRPALASPELEKGATAFIESLSKQAVDSLTDAKVGRAERIGRFRKMFTDSFAVEAIGRWLLGQHWRKATDAEKKEYLALFEDMMVASYVDRFAEYAGTTLRITRAVTENDKHATVSSEVQRPGSSQPVRVDWRVGAGDAGFKIVDVVIEGTSMSITMRSDFSSVINQKGGQISGLLDVMREKTASLKQEAARQ
ncbi:MAG: ABC transporter substrate-binding protein [Alphaproteobacteria bacterium]|nr:ABC transporter substrate-binding protein [Alphaproteobacteria bacterium]